MTNTTYKRTMRALVTIVSYLAFLSMSEVALSAEEPFDDPIAYVGHGVMFDRNGNQIKPTLKVMALAQKIYMGFLSDQLPEQERHIFKDKTQSLLAGSELDEQSRLVANSALIDWEISHADPTQTQKLGQLRRKHNYLKWLLQSTLAEGEIGMQESKPFKPSALLNKRLETAGLTEPAKRSTTSSGSAYIAECRNAGVPIPPDWGSKDWKSKGFLTTNFLGSPLKPAEVFIAEDKAVPGISIALPRYTSPEKTTINLLGIISLGKTSGKACFWDNQKNDLNFEIVTGKPKALTEFAGGAELVDGSGGRCTACHAGENPFIIHPKTSLGLPNLAGLSLVSDQWYEPLVDPTWPQNPGPLVGTTGACNSCHIGGGEGGRFPALSTAIFEYCGAVLGNASKTTMPPGNPSDASFAEHENALKALCTSPPSSSGSPGNSPENSPASIAETMESILLPLR